MEREEYQKYLRHKKWYKKRLEIYKRDNHTCVKCGSPAEHVHHTYYHRVATMPWEYPNESMISICNDCHLKEHESVIPVIDIKTGDDHSINWTSKDYDLNKLLVIGGKYKVGPYSFNSKESINKFGRILLGELKINKKIIKKDIVEFVQELYKTHPDYDSSLVFSDFIGVDYDDINKRDKRIYTNFVVYFENKTKHKFSNKKCVNNIKTK